MVSLILTLPPREPRRSSLNISHVISFLWFSSTVTTHSHFFHIKTKSLHNGLVSYFSPLFNLLQSHWAPSCSLNISGIPFLGPLHWCFPLSKMLFPHLLQVFTHKFLLSEASTEHLFKSATTLPLVLSILFPLSYIFFVKVLITF